MPPFTMQMTAQPDDIDELGHVNNAVWVRWMETLATTHWHAIARPEHRYAYFWVITRHEIDYLRALGPGETVAARTWIPDPPRGAKCDRLMEFIGADGKPRVRARTTWAIVEKASGRPIRVPPDVVAPFLA